MRISVTTCLLMKFGNYFRRRMSAPFAATSVSKSVPKNIFESFYADHRLLSTLFVMYQWLLVLLVPFWLFSIDICTEVVSLSCFSDHFTSLIYFGASSMTPCSNYSTLLSTMSVYYIENKNITFICTETSIVYYFT